MQKTRKYLLLASGILAIVAGALIHDVLIIKQAKEGLEFALNDDGFSYSVTGIGAYTDTNLIIPSRHQGFSVTSIGNNAFSSCGKLTSVVIPESVKNIGNGAFINCTNLDSCYINYSIKYNGTCKQSCARSSGV